MKAKWGVCGSGGIARRRTIPEGIVRATNAELHAVCDYDPEVARAVAQEFGGEACADEKELLATDSDIIYVATPVHLHLRQVRHAAEAGKHVFCEKPLGLNVSEADEMRRVCKMNGVKLGIGFMMRFHAQHQEALRIVREGKLGALVFARAQLSCWYPPIPGAWRQEPTTGGGGTLMDLGAHCLDLLEMYFGHITRVCCTIANRIHRYGSEDTSVVLVEFESGARGIVDALFNVPDSSSRNRLELYGSLGSILAEGTIGQGERGTMEAYLETEAKEYEAQQTREPGVITKIDPTPVNMYQSEVEAFSQAVLDDTEPPVSGKDGLRVQKILAACYESASSGRWIDLQ
ncbi:MAG: Gfo/Idh/MocA family oxidoreductase [Candidatus Hydrogenedentes bacterium]|nr:Gfo/Idh/MocA family oxidoreductase [Candidatus Hydrogenedentota bacterium]